MGDRHSKETCFVFWILQFIIPCRWDGTKITVTKSTWHWRVRLSGLRIPALLVHYLCPSHYSTWLHGYMDSALLCVSAQMCTSFCSNIFWVSGKLGGFITKVSLSFSLPRWVFWVHGLWNTGRQVDLSTCLPARETRYTNTGYAATTILLRKVHILTRDFS